MPEDHYQTVWNPGEYLKQYYSLPQLAEDDAHLMRTLTGWLHDTNRLYPTAIDIGCGPTIHNTFALAPYVEAIDLADYLPCNLAEARKWLDNEPAAHDWDALFQGVLSCDGGGFRDDEETLSIPCQATLALRPEASAAVGHPGTVRSGHLLLLR